MYSNIKEVMGVNDDDVYQSLYNDISTHAQEGRVLYLSRHGESEFNLYGKIGVSSNIIIKLPYQYFHRGPKQIRFVVYTIERSKLVVYHSFLLKKFRLHSAIVTSFCIHF